MALEIVTKNSFNFSAFENLLDKISGKNKKIPVKKSMKNTCTIKTDETWTKVTLITKPNLIIIKTNNFIVSSFLGIDISVNAIFYFKTAYWYLTETEAIKINCPLVPKTTSFFSCVLGRYTD